jgi:hypothetical protein
VARALVRQLSQVFDVTVVHNPEDLLAALEFLEDVRGVISDSIGAHKAATVKEKYAALPFVVYSGKPQPGDYPGVDEWMLKPDPEMMRKIKERFN